MVKNMKLQIRQGVFETNSSSTHAISICKYEGQPIPESIYFGFGEFGWDDEVYDDHESKAAYLWTAVCGHYYYEDDKPKIEEIKAALTKILNDNGVKSVEFATGEYVESYNKEYKYLRFDGYIDHGWELIKWVENMLEDPDLLIGYLFNTESFVNTGNDNDDTPLDWAENAIYTMYKGN
jgi:hypothetical protein